MRRARTRKEIEQIAKEDHLVHVEVRLEQREVFPVPQNVLTRPRPKTGVGDHQRAHHR
jgi:hypothetical protein